MDRLDTINSYFNQKERARLNELVQNTGGLPTMSKEEIRLSCVENDGYESAELNEKLYLHFRGFKRIENLEEYTSCKAIWLDSNGFEIIENLGHMPLRCLYLSKNLISTIQGLNNLSLLVTLDLSNNRITNVEGLEGCTSLKTINLQRNALSTASALEGLTACPSIDNVDITNNRIEGDVTSVLARLPTLHALSVNGNPCTQTQAFRKRTIAAIPTLAYLDRPIDAIERIGAHAFVTEGPEKEQEVRLAFIAKQKQDRSDELAQFRTWQREQLALRKEKMAAGDTEGLSLITEFTPEEQAQREAEAKKAADLEREMLDMGIGSVGQKYWQMQGRSDFRDDGVQSLEAAVHELKATRARQQVVQEEYEREMAGGEGEGVDSEDVRVELLDECPHMSAMDDIDENDADVPSGENFQKVQIETDEDDDADSSSEEENDISEDDDIALHSSTLLHNDTDNDQSNDQEEDSAEEVLEDTVEEPKWVHEQRVQESIEIYNRQRRLEKLQKEKGSAVSLEALTNPPIETFSTTQTTIDWQFINDESGAGGKVFWTEWMDLKLAELVQSCVYDFSVIADTFTELGTSAEFTQLPAITFGVGKHTKEILEALTEEDCRLRWAELDSKQWCNTPGNAGVVESDIAVGGAEGVTGGSVAPAVYKICVQPDVLGKGHGAQPTFAAMSSMANGLSSYLKVPTSFPSMADDNDEDEDEEDVEGDENTSLNVERFEELD